GHLRAVILRVAERRPPRLPARPAPGDNAPCRTPAAALRSASRCCWPRARPSARAATSAAATRPPCCSTRRPRAAGSTARRASALAPAIGAGALPAGELLRRGGARRAAQAPERAAGAGDRQPRARRLGQGEPAIQVLTLMHGTGNQEYVTRLVEESEHLREDRRSGRLRLIPLGSTDLGGDLALLEGGLASSRWHSQYSSLFYNMSFWESLKCDHVLTMQSDSLLCLNSKVHLSEFFNYDFVGAVSCGGDSNVSNGGLSLRNRQVMMRCVRRGIQDLKMQEDVFFSEACRDVARAPDLTVRDRFAIEQGFRHANVTPFGLHKPWHQEKSNQYRYVDQNLDMCEGARKLVSMQHE
ncbi:unnamed protein product, partial [Prorocentrum cordatum]